MNTRSGEPERSYRDCSPTMKNTCRTPQAAGIAIAAILALSPAAVLAQDAATTPTTPTIDGPIVALDPIQGPRTATTAPQIVVPETLASPASVTTSAPVVQQVPEQEPAPVEAEVVTPPPSTTRTAAPSSVPASAPASAASPDAEGSQPAEENAAIPAASDFDGQTAIETSPVPALATTEAVAEPTSGQEQDVVGWLGGAIFLILVLVLGLAAFLLVRTNRRKARAAEVIRPTVARPSMPVEPQAQAPIVETQTVQSIAPTSSRLVDPVATADGTVALPREMPATFEERDALLRRMIAAKPDRANPFTDGVARRKRARLILQSLGRSFENNEPWIDLSDYPQNWPALSRRYSKAA